MNWKRILGISSPPLSPTSEAIGVGHRSEFLGDYPCFSSCELAIIVDPLPDPFHQLPNCHRITPCLTRQPHGPVRVRVLVARLQDRRPVVDVRRRCPDVDRCDVAPNAEGSTDDGETSDGQDVTGGDDPG